MRRAALREDMSHVLRISDELQGLHTCTLQGHNDSFSYLAYTNDSCPHVLW